VGMKRVVMHIDRLVLKGYAAGERHKFTAELRTELGNLLADPTMVHQLAGLDHVYSLLVNSHNSASCTEPGRSGTAVARAIVGGLSR